MADIVRLHEAGSVVETDATEPFHVGSLRLTRTEDLAWLFDAFQSAALYLEGALDDIEHDAIIDANEDVAAAASDVRNRLDWGLADVEEGLDLLKASNKKAGSTPA